MPMIAEYFKQVDSALLRMSAIPSEELEKLRKIFYLYKLNKKRTSSCRRRKTR